MTSKAQELFVVPESILSDAPTRVRPPAGAIERGPGRPDKYLDADGRWPLLSASKVSQAADDPEGLMHWFAPHGRAAYKMRDDAADTGTAVHDAIEAHIHGDTFPGPDEIIVGAPDAVGAANAFAHFLRWEESRGQRLAYRATEIPMLSDTLFVGGTVDMVAESDDGLEVIDWKTSSRTRRSHVIQVAIYALLWEELRGDIVTSGSVLQLPKTPDGHAKYLRCAGDQFVAAKSAAKNLLKFAAKSHGVCRSLGL